MSTYSIDDFVLSQTANKIQLILNYEFDAIATNVYATFLDEGGSAIKSQVVYVPPEVYSTWTTDDSVLVQYVAKQLGVKIV